MVRVDSEGGLRWDGSEEMAESESKSHDALVALGVGDGGGGLKELLHSRFVDFQSEAGLEFDGQ